MKALNYTSVRSFSVLACIPLLLFLSTVGVEGKTDEKANQTGQERTIDKDEVVQLMELNRTITLTPDQQDIYDEVLSSIPAACCSTFSALTCCCECNWSRAVWGLTKRLIAKDGYDAEKTKLAVQNWVKTAKPMGSSGKACTSGRCAATFAQDGCGGMNEKQLKF